MLRFWKCGMVCCGLLLTVFALSLRADDDKKADKAPAGKSTDKPADKPEAKPEEKPVDLDNVPEGNNEELLTYIKKVMAVRPQSMDDIMKMSKAIGKASDKILDSDPTDDQLSTVLFIRMRLPMSPEDANAYADKLTKIAADFTKAGKAEMARKAVSMSYLAKLNGAGEDPEAFKKAAEESLKFLGEGKLQKGDMMLVMNLAQAVENVEDQKFAGDALEKIVGLLKNTKPEGEEKTFIEKFTKQLEGTLRRMKLVGNKIELEGHLLSGEKLDLAKYDGRVILVDFWATWCGPCVGEIPNMKKNYEAYHEKGFDIIGLSCDQTQETVEKFVKEREIPWAIVYGEKTPSPSFDYYGISGIPTMMLVGKDGKVISTTARGEELDKLLEKQFGPAEKKAEKKEPVKLQLKKEKKSDEKKE